MATAPHEDVDQLSGVTTTGHEWDGIKELNNPLPRWWLLVFYATIVWGIGYTFFYPAWPMVTRATEGILGYHTREALVDDMKALEASRGENLAALRTASLEDIEANPRLLGFARAYGKAAFAANCAACHGAGAGGMRGFPNLNDDDWLWGGTLAAVRHTIEYGIRSGHDQTRTGVMPAFVKDGILKREDALAVADYVRSIAGLQVEAGADLQKGQEVFATNCAACHGENAKGNPEMGAPNLTDGIWLYGSDRAAIVEGVTLGRGGVMPAWVGRLDEPTIKALTVYVHTLGGGQ